MKPGEVGRRFQVQRGDAGHPRAQPATHTAGERSPLCSQGRGPGHTVQATLLTGAQTASCLMIAVSQLPCQAPELQGTRPPPGHLSRGAQPSSKARAQALHHDSLAPSQLTPRSRAPPSPASPPQPLTTMALPTVSTVVPFQNAIEMEKAHREPFQTGFSSHSGTCIQASSVSFHSLKAHFFLVLSNIPLSGCVMVHLSSTEGHLGCFQSWQL